MRREGLIFGSRLAADTVRAGGMTRQGADGCKSRYRPATAAWGRSNRATCTKGREAAQVFRPADGDRGRRRSGQARLARGDPASRPSTSTTSSPAKRGRPRRRRWTSAFTRSRSSSAATRSGSRITRATSPMGDVSAVVGPARAPGAGVNRSRRGPRPARLAHLPGSGHANAAPSVPPIGRARPAPVSRSRCPAPGPPARRHVDGGPDEAFGFRGARGDPRRPAGDRQGRGDPRDGRGACTTPAGSPTATWRA